MSAHSFEIFSLGGVKHKNFLRDAGLPRIRKVSKMCICPTRLLKIITKGLLSHMPGTKRIIK